MWPFLLLWNHNYCEKHNKNKREFNWNLNLIETVLWNKVFLCKCILKYNSFLLFKPEVLQLYYYSQYYSPEIIILPYFVALMWSVIIGPLLLINNILSSIKLKIFVHVFRMDFTFVTLKVTVLYEVKNLMFTNQLLASNIFKY